MAFYTQVVPSSGEAQNKLAKIQRTHLSYLQLDENKEKLQKRSDLEDLITAHLSSVPHKEKFTCPKFLEVLRRSVENNSDLKANKASRAFDALEKYAVNLLSQPWRQEYRCIRLYSGFYQHHIDTHLSNAMEILHLMGYEDSSKMEVELSEPIDPDRVIDVSLNCLIAAVECQIMMKVMEKTGGCYTLREIAYIRRHNVCDVLRCVALLVGTQKRSRNTDSSRHDKSAYLVDSRIQIPNRSNGYVKVEKLVDVPCDWIDGLADTMEADAIYPEISYGSPWAAQKQMRNGHSLNSSISKPLTTDEHIATFYSGLSCLPKSHPRALYDPETRADSWGYVDQSLERKGYNKDHGERGDLLKSGPDLARYRRASLEARKMGIQPLNYATHQVNPMKTRSQLKPNSDLYHCMPPLFNPSPLTFDESELRQMANPFPMNSPGMAHRFPVTDNLINLENPYINPYFYPSYVSPHPKIYAGHVFPTSVPFDHNGHVHHPVYAPMPVPSAKLASEAQPARNPSSQNRNLQQEFERPKKIASKPEENRRSWYDNVGPSNGIGNGNESASGTTERVIDNGASMPAANKVVAHLCDQITLPPPMPFQSDAPPEAASVRQAKLMHRRRASDGVTDISVADTTVVEKSDKSNYLDVGTASRKSSSSSGERRPIRDEKLSKEGSLPTPRRGSSLIRHERSPSAGSIRSASYSSSASSQGKWSCWACTFLNGPELEICEMCSRSRNRGAESSPLTSGGHECQQCTLVNEKGAVKCVACGQSLENSPTYV